MTDILYSEINSIAYIRLNRPRKNNALNLAIIEQISDVQNAQNIWIRSLDPRRDLIEMTGAVTFLDRDWDL